MIPFISDDDLSAYLGTTVSETDLNVVIALDAACQVVRDELGLDVNYLGDDQIEIDGNGTRFMFLPQLPVIDVSEVLDPDGNVVDPDTYVVDKRLGELRFYRYGVWSSPTAYWWPGYGRYTVTYDHGWALSEEAIAEDPRLSRVPSSIRLVALELAAAVWNRSQIGATVAGTVTSETIGGYSYTVDASTATWTAGSALTEDHRTSLRAWRNVRAA